MAAKPQKGSEEKRQAIGKEINTWVQTVGIVIAAAWGVYTFVYREIVVPESAPVNVTVELQLKKLGAGKATGKNPEDRLVAVEAKVTASNPSSREVHLLPSAWIVYGYKVVPINERIKFADQANAYLSYSQAGEEKFIERHSFVPPTTVVAVGSLFSDAHLRPHETLTRTLIFHIPSSKYDMLDVVAKVPSPKKKLSDSLEWKLEADRLLPYRIDENGKREQINQDDDGVFRDPILDLDVYQTKSQLSLWQ